MLFLVCGWLFEVISLLLGLLFNIGCLCSDDFVFIIGCLLILVFVLTLRWLFVLCCLVCLLPFTCVYTV